MTAEIVSNRLLASLLAVGLLVLGACDDDSMPAQPDMEALNIVETAQSAGNFQTLIAALQAANLDTVLEGPGPFTVFAPTDAAFGAISADVLADLLADGDLLTSVLTYHVIPGRVPASEVVGLTSATTVNGASLDIEVVGSDVFIDGVQVVTTDIEASNGIIHVIAGVLTPEPIANIVQTARDTGGFDTLVAAVEAAGLVDVLSGPGPFTVFAPTDEAFAALPEGTLDALLADPDALAAILTYHVVPGAVLAADVVQLSEAETLNSASIQIALEGESVSVNAASVVATDILTRNGIIHVIDEVLIP